MRTSIASPRSACVSCHTYIARVRQVSARQALLATKALRVRTLRALSSTAGKNPCVRQSIAGKGSVRISRALRAWLCVRLTPNNGGLGLHRRRDRARRALKQRGPKKSCARPNAAVQSPARDPKNTPQNHARRNLSESSPEKRLLGKSRERQNRGAGRTRMHRPLTPRDDRPPARTGRPTIGWSTPTSPPSWNSLTAGATSRWVARRRECPLMTAPMTLRTLPASRALAGAALPS